MQHAPDTDAQDMFARLRAGEDPSTILAIVDTRSKNAQQKDTPAESSTPAKLLSPQPHTQQYTDLATLQKFSGTPDLSDAAPLATVLQSKGDVLMEAFSVFLKCTTTIFHIYTREEVDLLLTESLQANSQVPLSVLCEACAIAAVGSRFSRSKISPELGEYFFSITKQLLDECIEKTPLQAIKVCALLAICNIVNKATAAFAYVG